MSDCDTWEAATVRRETLAGPTWETRPPHTHVSAELLDDPEAREFIESAYEIGEKCQRPFTPAAFHAHLRPATTHRPETTTDAREANPHG